MLNLLLNMLDFLYIILFYKLNKILLFNISYNFHFCSCVHIATIRKRYNFKKILFSLTMSSYSSYPSPPHLFLPRGARPAFLFSEESSLLVFWGRTLSLMKGWTWRVWWCLPVTPTLGELRQEDLCLTGCSVERGNIGG